MAIPTHFIHVYQRPKLGTSFLKKYQTFNYQHTISAQGWFDTASCDIVTSSTTESQNILNSYLGCYVAVYVDNPVVPVWEGLINRITFNAGLASYTISLDEMANRVSVVFTAAANATSQTAVVNNTTSQAIYGVKEDQIELGADPSAGTWRTTLRDTILSQRAFPQTSVSQAQGQTNLVHLELLGIFHTLEWEKLFTAALATTVAANTRISNAISGAANGTTFFNNADVSQIAANAVTVPDQQRNVSRWEVIQKIAEMGDATNYWVAGILPTDPNTKTRRLYYRQSNASIGYTAYQRDGLKPRNPYGQPVAPWLVVPDQGIRVNDMAVGFNTSSQYVDPRVTYIQSISYDANSQQVTWLGTDDTTARAAFSLKRSFKSLAKNAVNTAPLRTLVT